MGLYDDAKVEVISGDLLDVDYWQTKFEFLKFEAALKTGQPGGVVKMLVPGVINGCEVLLKAYPRHEEIRGWKAMADEVRGEIDQYASPAEFQGDFAAWQDLSYEMGWRFYHLAGVAANNNDWALAALYACDSEYQLSKTVERMSGWDMDVQQWVKNARAEMQRLKEESAKRWA